MRKLKQVLSEIELLVHRANYQNEFLEFELQQMLEQIFEDPYRLPGHNYNPLKKVLLMITEIDKSTNFGYYFYDTLQENPFPFCVEVLKSAVYNEKDYNLNDKALKSYVRVYMIENGFDPQLVTNFDKIIPEGHGQHYFDAFARLNSLNISHNISIKPCFFELMYSVINRDTFPMTQKKAAIIIGLLNLVQFRDTVIGKSHQLISQDDISTEQILVIIHLVKLLSFLNRDPLPDTINKLMFDIVSSAYNGNLTRDFHRMKGYFQEYVSELWEAGKVV